MALSHPARRTRALLGPRGMTTPVDGVTSTLDDLGDGKTAIVIRQRHVPEAMRIPEARAGFLTSFDKLDEYLTHLMHGDRS